ncbi:MAG: hypothetical protein DHS20C05_01950 [Hyphococcus sp.]|nr:MAG: hypothetical protein DHS20C05_01950 [Marinicaulis sp.]
MNRFSFAGVFAGLVAVFSAAHAEDVPAERRGSGVPEYPASCRPAPDEDAGVQTVSVTYNVTEAGLPIDVRVRDSSDPCFEEVAVATVRSWSFTPRTVNGEAQRQNDLETTFIFKFDHDTVAEEFDARPIKRVPPYYPSHCSQRAGKEETVLVEFDVTVEGTTENIRAVESTNRCFNRASIYAVKQWKFHPKTIAGVPVVRKSAQTTIRYVSQPAYSTERLMRRQLSKKLDKIRQDLKRNGDAQAALDELAAIEEEYGDSFSRTELGVFHQLRAAARIQVGDYAGALDDLYIVKGLGGTPDGSEAINNTIEQLEAILEAQKRAAEQVQEEPAE